MTKTLTQASGGYAPSGKDSGIVKPKGTSQIPGHAGLITISIRSRKPEWLKVRSPGGAGYLRLKQLMRSQSLHTVCEEAGCPNIGECWEAGTATFMILGDVCTRACKYCGVAHGLPTELDLGEPGRVADSVRIMELEHVVITSVNRDELEDQGAGHFADCIAAVREAAPSTMVEVLIPDFQGRQDLLQIVSSAGPEVIAYNIETVDRMTPTVRDPRVIYKQSLAVLQMLKAMRPDHHTKSSIMIGLGETES